MKKNSILQPVILISLLLITQNLFSQTNTSPFQTVCAGSLAEPYLMNPPTLGSSYQWTLTGGGTINNGLTSDNITVDWGSTPGTYTLTVIETDVNGCIGDPVTLDITVSPLPSATVGTSQTACVGSIVPDLFAIGANVNWYSDPALINNVFTGNSFPTGQTLPGIYTYYVTESLNGCEGVSIPVTLEIFQLPSSPISSDASVCEGALVPDLFAIGANVNWYSDPALTTNVFTGNSFSTGQTLPGLYTYYVTNSQNGCESVATSVDLTINATPAGPISSDETVCEGGLVPDLSATGTLVNWYSDAALTNNVFSGNIFVTGQVLPNVYTYYVTNSQNGCESVPVSVDLTINPKPVTGPISHW